MRRIKHNALSLIACIALMIAVWSAAVAEAKQEPISWSAYQNKRFGFTVYYPSGLFVPDPEPAEKGGRSFTAKSGSARIAAFGMLDPKWLGAELYDKKRITSDGRADDEIAIHLYQGELREEGDAYESVIEKKVQRNWLTITGMRGDRIYFEKFIFSCKDKVISALSYSYDKSEEQKYAPLLKTILRRFGAGSGSETPRCI